MKTRCVPMLRFLSAMIMIFMLTLSPVAGSAHAQEGETATPPELVESATSTVMELLQVGQERIVVGNVRVEDVWAVGNVVVLGIQNDSGEQTPDLTLTFIAQNIKVGWSVDLELQEKFQTSFDLLPNLLKQMILTENEIAMPNETGIMSQNRSLQFPGSGKWYVCQGYWGPISHGSGNLIYSFDLSTSSSSFSGAKGCSPSTNRSSVDQTISAPGDGVAVQYGKEFVLLKLDSGGCIAIGHLKNRVSNGRVRQGSPIGAIVGPTVDNGGYAHIHISAFPSTCWVNPVSFSENNNFRFYGNPDMPNSSNKTVNQYRGTEMSGVVVAGTTCSIGQYKSEYYNNRSLSGSPTFTRCENSPLSYDWGGGGPGNGVGNDNFSARWTGRFTFNEGTYTFIARTDDGIRVWVDGNVVVDSWKDQAPTEHRGSRSMSTGEHEVKVEYYENGGGSVAQLRWEQGVSTSPNLALNRTTWATSQESSSYTPYRGNDGSTGTRWSSASRGYDEWWRVDLGNVQTFDKVIIRWEAAYASSHFVGWSNDGINFTGYWYGISDAGNYAYNLGSRTYRYVAILMKNRAPCCGNFSFWEFEVYRTTANMLPLDLLEELKKSTILLNPVDELQTIRIAEGITTNENSDITPAPIPEATP